MIKILKASAGSGKTYALAQNYLSLLTERLAYRHILAVTFTNKATAEMKSRILKFLEESDEPAKKEMLRDILHDYSAFSVSTIDKFFQQALKAFAREIGQVADYQIDLDKQSLIHEAMDRILDGLSTSDTEVLDWLRRSVAEDLSNGRKVNIEGRLYDMGERLMMGDAGSPDQMIARFSKENLDKIRLNCNQIIKEFTTDINEAAKLVKVEKPDSIKQLAPFLKGYATHEFIKLNTKTLKEEAAGSRFVELLTGDRYRWYCTAWLLREMSFSLGLAGEFFRSFKELLKEKNVMVLDESNTILKDIIAGSDAPFVYEKMGVRYENFLLDEFQDTSNIQWSNFLPLLKESEASDHKNLIVGDVKQSIYRWRDSDWKLLAHTVEKEFPTAEVESMDRNWRSCKTIVDFNNEFFKFAAKAIGHEDLYADVKQEVSSDDPQKGQVRVSFCDNDSQIPMVLESINDARKAGAGYGDIAVLVRANQEGGTIAKALIEAGIPVISDDSLSLQSSVIIRKLTGILANHENPDDKINSYLAEKESVKFPDEYHSLVDLCELLLRQLQKSSPDDFEGETLYIQAFMDDLRDWTAANGNELRFYLQHWNESKLTISSPEVSSAVRIITVHKSKGLEFPYLIFPYANKVGFYKAGWRWCQLRTEGTPFIPEAEGLYPVELKESAANTLFSADFEAEKDMQLVDNINVFYVALTRAEKCLHVIAANPSKKLKDFSQLLYSFCAQMDDSTRGDKYDFEAERKRIAAKKAEEAKKAKTPPVVVKDLPYAYKSIPIGTRLKVSVDASDFFGPDGAVGAAASPRRNGIAMHGILSAVQTADELRDAVDGAVLDGQLSPEEGEEVFALLQERIAAHPEWFAARGLNETAVINEFGDERRPDRVVIGSNGITIVDYKFGESSPESDRIYSKQVSNYMSIFRSLGYKNVSGAVWYVVPDKLITL